LDFAVNVIDFCSCVGGDPLFKLIFCELMRNYFFCPIGVLLFSFTSIESKLILSFFSFILAIAAAFASSAIF